MTDPLPEPTSPAPRRLAWGCLLGLYLLAFPYHPGLRSPNELCRLWQTRAIVEYGELNLNQAIRDYGYVGDLSVKDLRYYPSKAPLLSFAAVPLYKVLRVLGGDYRYAVPELALVFFSRLFFTVLPTLLLLVLLRRFLGAYVAPALADAVTVTYGLGSLAFSYSLLFMSHQPSAVLVFCAFFLLWRRARGEWGDRAYLLAGAAAGAALMAEYTAALPILGVLLYGVLSAPAPRARQLPRGLGLALVGSLPFVLSLLAYHQAVFGHPLHSGYLYLADAAYQPWHVGGFLGIRFPDPRAFALSFFSPLRGLFVLSPFLLLAFAGLGRLRRTDRPLFWTVIALTVGYSYFTSSFSYESWGWTTGPRHLTAWVPFLLLPAALSLEWAGGRPGAWRVVGAAACGVSILITGVVSFVNYVPDSVTTAVAGLAWPLLRQGYLPPSLLALAWANPFSGWVLGLALLAAAGAVVFLITRDPSGTSGRRFAAAVVLGLLWFGVLATVGGDTAGDLGAQNHLRSVWLTPPGRPLDLWPARSR